MGGGFFIRKTGYVPGDNLVIPGDDIPVPVKLMTGGTGTTDTELPAAAALTDDMANPTAPAVAGHNMLWDGAGWDRQSGVNGRATVQILASENLNTDGQALTPARMNDVLGSAHSPLVVPWIFNGTNFDRQRNNSEITVLASAARTADTNSPDQTNYNWRGGHIIINVTVLTTSVIPTIKGKDPISGTYYSLLVGSSIASTGITILKIYPGILAVANAAASDILPRTWRLEMDHLDATTMTYSCAFVGIV
jgi:hypothetical protein